MSTKNLFAVVGIALLMATMAFAGNSTANLGVSASITSNCTINTTAVSFGAYDPIAGTAVTNSGGTVTVACTSDVTAPYVTLDQGQNPTGGSTDAAPQRQLSDGSGHLLTYNLYTTSGYSTVWGNTGSTGQTGAAGDGTGHALTVYGKIDAAQHTAPAGSYADTIVATVTF